MEFYIFDNNGVKKVDVVLVLGDLGKDTEIKLDLEAGRKKRNLLKGPTSSVQLSY